MIFGAKAVKSGFQLLTALAESDPKSKRNGSPWNQLCGRRLAFLWAYREPIRFDCAIGLAAGVGNCRAADFRNFTTIPPPGFPALSKAIVADQMKTGRQTAAL